MSRLAVRDLDAYLYMMLRHGIGRRLQRQKTEQRRLRQRRQEMTQQPANSVDEGLSLAMQSLAAKQCEMIWNRSSESAPLKFLLVTRASSASSPCDPRTIHEQVV